MLGSATYPPSAARDFAQGSPAKRTVPVVKLQSGVLAYKIGPHGKVQVLLVRTKRSKRWSIPKGKAESHLSLGDNAAKEAFEEAGVRGEVCGAAAGMFRAAKR